MESELHSGVSDVNATSRLNNCSSYGPSVDSRLSYENKPGEILKNLQNVSYIFRQDVVRKKSNGRLGIVTDVAGDSYSDSSLTDDEDDEVNETKAEAGSSEQGKVEKCRNLGEDNEINNYKPGPLTYDQVRVLWLDGYEKTETTNDVEIVDRPFAHGDYVAAASDPTGQIGEVIDVSINVDLLAHDGSILKDKPSKDLRRIRDFTVGDHVVLGPWLGRIEDVFDNVTVQLHDGSVCKVMKADPSHLKPVGKDILEDGHFPYYPGQHVKATSSSVFKRPGRFGFCKTNKLEGTVTEVTVGSVNIYWIASAGYGPGSSTYPAREQSPKNLKLLSCFAHTNWQLGDWCLLPSLSQDSSCTLANEGFSKPDSNNYSAQDQPESTETGDESDAELTSTEESSRNDTKSLKNAEISDKLRNSTSPAPREVVHEPWPLNRKKVRKLVIRKDKKSRKKVENFERALLIFSTHTKVDVIWQDGTMQQGLNSTSLIPVYSPGEQEFAAEQYVVEKAVDSDDVVETRRVGVVKSVSAKDRTARVRWLKPVARAGDPREFDKEEMVSVYELDNHPDYDYCYGDIVVKLPPISSPAKRGSLFHYFKNMLFNSSDEPEHENESHHGRGDTENSLAPDMSTEFSDLSWVGNVTGLKNGDIEVTWADGMISKVGPQAIYIVGPDCDESMTGGNDASDDASSWRTVEDDMDSIDNAEENVADKAGDISPETEDNDTISKNSRMNGALSIPLAAIGFLTRLASGIFSRRLKHSDGSLRPDELELDIDPDGGSSTQNLNDNENQISNPITNCEIEEHEVAESLGNLKLPQSDAPPREEFFSTFKGFDIVRDPVDHHFVHTHGQNNAARKWLKKVQQDWDILQNNLPEGIYVRVYEDRMDLLRAAIVGPYGTPYQDGLFFFDFQLPPEYPDVPPSAYYHSGGWKLNPNLYEDGKICLSLLNTWTGRRNEVWNFSQSSILQVLVSIQGLVLNSKPYFNEAGYDKQIGTAEGEKNSLSYNENCFLLNCKTMMYLIRNPPKDFGDLVIEHFKKRGYYILKACDAYTKGHLIGSLTKDASITDSNNTNLNSVGLKLMLGKVVPKLLPALQRVGANCHEFEHLNQIQLYT